MPVEILLMGSCWLLGDLVCTLYFFLPVILISASVGNMVLISAERYVAVCDPLRYRGRITERTVTVGVCLCWSCSAVYSVVLLHGSLQQPGRFNTCVGECMVTIDGDVDLVVAFVLPIIVIVVLNVRVFFAAASQARAVRSQDTTEFLASRFTKASELKAARTLGLVVLVFLICYSPYYCLCLTGRSILIGSSTESITSFLMYLNSCLNPLLYALFCPWFRKAVGHILSLQILQPGSCEANIL